MEKLKVGKHVFKIVDSVPSGYIIWNIGDNMPGGYLPLCEVFKGTYDVNTDTLKAIKLERAQEVLDIAGRIGCDKKPEDFKKYYNRYKNSKNDYTRQRALKALNAANILSAVKFD